MPAVCQWHWPAAANFNTAGFNVTLSGSLSGPGSLTKLGNGTLTAAGVNTYTGGTTLDAGTLSLGSSGALPPTGTIRFAGGTLQATSVNSTDYSSLFSTAGGQIFSIDTNGQTVIWGTGLTSSGGSLAKLGAGTLILTAANTYTGATTVSAGTLQLGDGTAGHDGSLSTSGVTNSTGVAYDLLGSQTAKYPISGTGSLLKAGSGLLALSGANTYSGLTSINNGILNLGNAGAGRNRQRDLWRRNPAVYRRQRGRLFEPDCQ